MGTLIWLILAQALPVLVLANTTDTNNDTLLYDDVDDDEYSLISEEDTETSGDFFEDLIIAQLDALDKTYDH
jgi:hypothetical protein